MARKLPVKWFNYLAMSGDGGAPEITNVAGTRIAVLDACLIDGFNVRSVVSFTIAGGVGSITFSGIDHGYIKHQVVAISGASDDQYNGDWRVTDIDGATIEVDASGVANTSVAGTLSCKTAPIGDWEKVYSATNKAVYRSTADNATGLLLRVDDDYATYSAVRGYEAMTDIDTGSGPFPTTAQVANAYWNWHDGGGVASVRPWQLVGDGLMFYFSVHAYLSYSSVPNNYVTWAYGDIESFVVSDAYSTLINVSSGTNISNSYSSSTGQALLSSYTTGKLFIARSYTQVGSSVQLNPMVRVNNSGGSSYAYYPNPINSELLLSDYGSLWAENVSGTARGLIPGLIDVLQRSAPQVGSIIEHALGVEKNVIMVGGSSSMAANESGQYRIALDITGPWR